MKRTKLGWLCSAVVTLGLIASASFADDPDPGDQPQPIDVPLEGVLLLGTTQETAPSLRGPYVGVGEININGDTFLATSLSDPLVLMPQPNQGRIVAASAHVFNLGNGNTITTADDLRLNAVGPGLFQAYVKMTVTGGTGRYANARGQIEAYGWLWGDGISAGATWSLDGRVIS